MFQTIDIFHATELVAFFSLSLATDTDTHSPVAFALRSR